MRAREYIETPDLGCWIEPDGTVHQCDHNKDIHHADIAMDVFDMEQEDDEDDFTREEALSVALSENWLRISAIDTMGFSVNWNGTLTPAQLKAALPIIATAKKLRFDQFYLDHNDNYNAYERFGDFLREFRRINSI